MAKCPECGYQFNDDYPVEDHYIDFFHGKMSPEDSASATFTCNKCHAKLRMYFTITEIRKAM